MDDENFVDEEIDEQQEAELLEEEISLAEKAKREIEEKLLKNKLKAILVKVSQSGKMKLSETDKRIVKKAKQYPKLKPDITQINLVLSLNSAKNTSKFMSTLGPVLPYILIGALIIVLIIAVIAIVGSIMPWLFPDEDKDAGVNAIFGIKGTDFYGARMVYRDDDRASKEIVEDYVEFVENGILQAEQITTVTASNGGETFNVELTINIELPNSDYDYSTFNEADFKTDYAELYVIVYDMAKAVYKVDYGTDFNGVSLIQCVDEIKYFGYGNLNETKTHVTNAIIAKSSFISNNDTESKLVQDDINLAIQNNLDAHYSTYSTARAEKLFVKDYILEGEEMMSNISKENYVAMIFMPRKDVTFTKFSFAVGNADLSNFTININGDELTTDGNNLGTEEKQSFIYGANLEIIAEKFEDVDENNLTALESDMNLFDVAKLDNALTYLKLHTGGYLTIKTNGIVVNLFNTEKYCFVEYETMWK